MVRYAQCCQPVPGDPWSATSRGARRSASTGSDCPNLLTLVARAGAPAGNRLAGGGRGAFVVRLAVSGETGAGLYADICEAISEPRHEHPLLAEHRPGDGSRVWRGARRDARITRPR